MSDVQIHWFAIVNSVVIVLFLSGKCCCLVPVKLKTGEIIWDFDINFLLEAGMSTVSSQHFPGIH